ncbi:MAG TPA: LytR C-terminal domain-containing protein [Gaiellaceae bacterium]|nr:LytR C-terminal domain-containing protein [Gaiellaceae bacterium]
MPWRTAALVAAGVAAVELVLLVAVGLALAAEPFADDAGRAVATRTANEPGPGPQGEREPTSPTLSRGETSVLVLNGNGLQGAAATAAGRVRTHGYLIAGTGNAPRSDLRRSLVMYRPGYRREAERLAKDLGVRRVGPLDGVRAAALQGAHVAFVVGRS